MQDKKVFSSLSKEKNTVSLKNNSTSSVISIDKFTPIFKDDLSITDAKILKITNDFVDTDINNCLINDYRNQINQQSKKFFSDFFSLSKDKKMDHHKKQILTSLWKQYKLENSDFLQLLDDVIFNIEVDWNDKFNYSSGFNLFNTKLSHKPLEIKKNNSIIIEKPLEVKINKDINWNDNLIKSIIQEDNDDKISNKKKMDELKNMSSNEISQIIKKHIYVIENLDGYIYSLENLYCVVATKKPTKLAISLYKLINLLKNNSEAVKELISSVPNFNSFEKSSDFELINEMNKSIDQQKILNLLNSEILDCKVIYDKTMNLYTLSQQVSHNIFLNEIHAAIDYSSGKVNKKEKHKLMIASSDDIANTSNISNWRNKLYKFVKKLSKNNKNDELFMQLNSEIGTIYDLKQLANLLEQDFNKKLSNKNMLYKTNYHDVEQYCLKESVKLNQLSSFILIYKLINFHFDLILLIQSKLRKLNDWETKYSNWVDEISKNKSGKEKASKK